MIKIGDKTYRNLEEQVQYLTNFHDVNQGLAQWGIKIIGQLADASALEDIPTEGLEFGDTYAIGAEPPYDFYIWTRTSISGEHGYWFNFGEISIAGPQGPQGPAGKDGATGQSTEWVTVLDRLPNAGAFNDGTMLLMASTGDVYKVSIKSSAAGKQWGYVCNIRGPQGIQGIQGPKGDKGDTGPQGEKGQTGDAGGFINIVDILSNANQLPNPSSLRDLTKAFLVGTTEPYDLYIQVGEDSNTSIWENTGPLNAATLVMVDGQYQNMWDANTKLDKNTATTAYNQVYIKRYNGEQMLTDILTQPTEGYSAAIPTNGYVDNNFVKRTTTYPNMDAVYGRTSSRYNFEQKEFTMSKYISDGCLTLGSSFATSGQTEPTSGGTLVCKEPINPYQIANKKYVDDSIASVHGKQYYAVWAGRFDWQTDDEQSWTDVQFTFAANSSYTGATITLAGLADMLMIGDYTSAEKGAYISYSNSNGYAIQGPLISIWSEDGATVKAKVGGRAEAVILKQAQAPFITRCGH